MSDVKIRVRCGDCEIEYDSRNFKETHNPAYTKDGYCAAENFSLIKTIEALTDSIVKLREAS